MIQYLFVIYNTLGKLNVASNTALMSTGDQYLMVVTSIQQFLIILFNSNNHSDNYMVFTSFEQLRTELDSSRKAREAHYIHKGKTLEPLGVNKRDDL